MVKQDTAKRRPGRPPQPQEPKRQVHLYLPESLAQKADERRCNVAMSAYILQLIENDIKLS